MDRYIYLRSHGNNLPEVNGWFWCSDIWQSAILTGVSLSSTLSLSLKREKIIPSEKERGLKLEGLRWG
jgi:hypothetical protein